jgi:hypothetical protein
MADGGQTSLAERIDRALARIEASAKQLATNNHSLADRNKALHESLRGALATLDSFLEERGRG